MPQKVVLVTGCTAGGIGHGLCKQFASQGCRVYASARRVESMDGLEELGCSLLALDVNSEASIKAAIDKIISEAGHIDILVNNAGRPGVGALLDIDMDVARSCVETNVFGVLAMSRAVAKHMVPRGSGLIANVGSIVGYAATPWAGTYSFSKAAVHSMSDALRLELAPFGVQVAVIAPGSITSNFGNAGEASITMPEDSFYTSVTKFIYARAQMSQGPSATPTNVFAAHVVSKLLRKNVPRYITYGTNSFTFLILYYLPFFIKDYLLSRRLGTIYVKRIKQ
ncbi:hypothetical protein BCR43DRAFT_489644 [Syncephalastrum racemosum]|uniref:Oxidoreductase n=1 Tax=Syncephalastrum racemosum TaxID=13706 RepID=A0A1X2HEH5_SYNRA|nr:hypothetical protein BCR43DRAFT_489644 [Syncephalastrum racemosum]